MFVVIVGIIAVVIYFVFTGGSEDTTAPLLVGDNAIYVSDAMPAVSVQVGFAVLAEGGYVVMHEDSEGKPGAIIGNSDVLSQGESQDFEVMLSRESVDGETLYAMLHSDNGDGAFNPAEDKPIKDDQENVVLMRFQVSSDAEESGVISL